MTHPTNADGNRPRRRRRRRVLAVVGAVVLTGATLAAMAVAGALVGNRDMHRPVPAGRGLDGRTGAAVMRGAAGSAAEGRGRRLVVAFVAGETGTVASDLLAPYDIFASSPAFDTYVVAADARPVPLEGGPALVPTYAFADVDADPALTPDLVVVPALTDPTGTTEATLRQWVTTRHGRRGADPGGVCRLRGAGRDRDARRSRRHQPLVAHR